MKPTKSAFAVSPPSGDPRFSAAQLIAPLAVAIADAHRQRFHCGHEAAHVG